MAVTPVPDFHDVAAVAQRARRAALAAGELTLEHGAWESPLDPDLQAAVRQILEDGTYARAASAVAASDPDLA